MTDADFEEYCFLRLYSIDLDTALNALRVTKRYKKLAVKCALLRDVTVTYGRPFSTNRGIEITKHQLSISHVPKNLRALHEELMQLRNNQFAHTDLKFHNPKVAKFGTRNRPVFPMTFKNFDYQKIFERLNDVETLIKSIDTSITSKIQHYEKHI
jgi:hypothetical protein